MIVKTSMAAPDIIIRNGTDIKVFDTWTTIIFFLVLSVQSAPQKQLSIAWCEGLLERYSNAYYMSDYTLIVFDIVIAFVIFFVIVIAIACDIVFVIVYFFVFVIVLSFSYQINPLGENGWAVTAGHGPHVPDVHQLQVLHPQAPRLHKVWHQPHFDVNLILSHMHQ